MAQIIPSVIAETEPVFAKRLEHVLQAANRLHLDVMDNSFVNAESLTFKPQLPEKRTEIHLMVEEPFRWIKWAKKAASVIVHAEVNAVYPSMLGKFGELVDEIGLAMNPGTTIRDHKKCIEVVDVVQVMTVQPGSYGGRFRESQLSLVKELEERYPEKPISVDGHVTPKTIGKLAAAGASRFVSGSFIQKTDKASEAIEELSNAIDEQNQQ